MELAKNAQNLQNPPWDRIADPGEGDSAAVAVTAAGAVPAAPAPAAAGAQGQNQPEPQAGQNQNFQHPSHLTTAQATAHWLSATPAAFHPESSSRFTAEMAATQGV